MAWPDFGRPLPSGHVCANNNPYEEKRGKEHHVWLSARSLQTCRCGLFTPSAARLQTCRRSRVAVEGTFFFSLAAVRFFSAARLKPNVQRRCETIAFSQRAMLARPMLDTFGSRPNSASRVCRQARAAAQYVIHSWLLLLRFGVGEGPQQRVK